MRTARPLLLLLPVLLGACAEPPFIDYGTTVTLEKPLDPLLQSGTFSVCHASDTPMSEVQALARDRCDGYGLQTWQGVTQRWQCRTTAPHSTQFACYDPEMRDQAGAFINPFDKRAVAAWEKRTGKKARLLNPNLRDLALPGEAPPEPESPAAAPAPTPAPAAPAIPAVPAITPQDMAGKPAMPPPPPAPVLPPPPPTPPAEGGFTLPQGSWGDSFKE